MLKCIKNYIYIRTRFSGKLHSSAIQHILLCTWNSDLLHVYWVYLSQAFVHLTLWLDHMYGNNVSSPTWCNEYSAVKLFKLILAQNREMTSRGQLQAFLLFSTSACYYLYL